MKGLLAMLVISYALPVLAQDDTDAGLLRDEVRDAESRQQDELASRIEDLEQQQRASRALAEKQQKLIDALEARIKALQETDSERSNPQE